ncbi:MAG: hypothetical protein CM15mP81_18700 [Alphaproteobacteria bacterium]|nr:MAG: hypothetical protein CM15mP81_18700 [Alphaproteobacteria bacterium]
MYARVANIIAQNELQLTMWIETFKAISAKPMSEFGSIQITITKSFPNKAIMMNVFPNKETADKAKKAVAEKIKQEREMMKLEISEGEVVFSQNSLTHE